MTLVYLHKTHTRHKYRPTNPEKENGATAKNRIHGRLLSRMIRNAHCNVSRKVNIKNCSLSISKNSKTLFFMNATTQIRIRSLFEISDISPPHRRKVPYSISRRSRWRMGLGIKCFAKKSLPTCSGRRHARITT